MELRPKCPEGDGPTTIAPCFRCKTSEDSNVTVKLSIADSFIAKFESKSNTPDETFSADEVQGSLNQDTINEHLVDGCLTLSIAVETETDFETSQHEKVFLCQEKIVKGLKSMIGNKEISDFTYRVDDQDFSVHKAVLAGKFFNPNFGL